MKRIFAAYPIEGEVSDEFLRFSERNKNIEGIRWTPRANLHITLFFIGEVEEESIPKIISRLEEIKSSPFSLQFEKIEIRTTKRKPSMIWAKFLKSDEYAELSKAIHERASEFMTIEVSHKDPIPHCTLARIKSNADVSQLDLSFCMRPVILVDRVELWMTVQKEGGVVYERLGVFGA